MLLNNQKQIKLIIKIIIKNNVLCKLCKKYSYIKIIQQIISQIVKILKYSKEI